MDKQKIIDIALWAIVAYAVALLIYWTLKIFNQNAESISALGSLLSASATFFAAYVAVKLFNDWRDPANYERKIVDNKLTGANPHYKMASVELLKELIDEANNNSVLN